MSYKGKLTGKQIDALPDRINELSVALSKLVVDSELSDTSENPVQNKVLAKILKFT